MIRCALLRGQPDLDPACFLRPEEAGLLGPRAVAKRRGDFYRGRFIAKKLLMASFTGTGPMDHCVVPDERGVPVARDGCGIARGVSLSITHTRGFAAAAVVQGPAQVGIDAEREIESRELIAGSYFTQREQSLVAGAPEPARMATTVWAAKEAVTKALGEGLRIPLLSMELGGVREASEDGWSSIHIRIDGGGELPAWAWNEQDCVIVVALAGGRLDLRPHWTIAL